MKSYMRIGASIALALAAGAAGAVDITTVPAANRIYFGGATATDNTLEAVFRLASGGVCQAGTIDIYRSATGATRAIACTAAIGSIAGTNIAFFKESNGGSGNGTTPVANATNLSFLDVANPAFACTGPTTTLSDGTGPLNDATQRTGCGPNISTPPQAGIADVEPRLLNATQAQIDLLGTNGVLGVVFAPAVSLNLYRALQAAQGLTQDDLPANVPSLTRSQLSALYSGFYSDWSQMTDLTGLPSDSQVYVCRRGDSSGTQASFESYILNQRCVDGVTGMVEASQASCEAGGCVWNNATGTGANTFGDDLVFAASGTGDVRLCLDARDDAGLWAIGVISTENLYNNTDREFRYVGIDGAAPTLTNVGNGSYTFFTENVINRRNGALNATQTAVVDYLVANLGSPTLLTGINAGFQNTSGDGGVLAVPNFDTINPNPSPVNQAAMRSNPVNSMVRNGNNCTPPITAGTTESGGL